MKYLIYNLFLCCLSSTLVLGQNKNIEQADTSKKSKASTLKLDSPKAGTILKNNLPVVQKQDSLTLQISGKSDFLKELGKIDTADLKLTKCDFEKEASAMVLFDVSVMLCGITDLADVKVVRHRRIKIFNENGKIQGNIKLEYDSRFGYENISGIVAETINLVNGKIEITKLDPKLIYTTRSGKDKNVITFTMPDIKAGSVIDYTYIYERKSLRNIPEWAFQSDLPTRNSMVYTILNPYIGFSVLKRTSLPFEKDTTDFDGLGHVWAMKNIPSAKNEPYMRSAVDGLQSIKLLISQIKVYTGTTNLSSTWADIGREITDYPGFSKPYDQRLTDEDKLIAQTKALNTDPEKVAFLFNYVKDKMKWNENENWISKDGIKAAWKKNSGNWGEINMILYHLLKQSGVKAHPMVVSTRENGQIIPGFANIYQLNKLIVYVPLDSTRYYILDATDKYNTYNDIPYDLLNGYGLILNKEEKKFDLLFIKKDQPSRQAVFINAEIKPDGKMNGTADMASYSYNKSTDVALHKKLDEKQYYEYLTNNDNNLQIKSLKMENAEVDSLPLIQNIGFNLELPGTDDKYIYFNPNLFTTLNGNPFIVKSRVSDIDFGCNKNYKISGRYTMPKGYKVESLPKSINLTMDDKSITFKRLVVAEDDLIQVSYVININRSFFLRAEYPGIYDYFKKMDETLNEPIILKKQ